MKKSNSKKLKKAVKNVSVKKIKLNKTEVLRVSTGKDTHPAVVHSEPGVVEIKPVPHKRRESWWDWLRLP